MKTLTQQEYSALPIEKRRYWKRRNPDDWTSHDRTYIPIQINLEDAEGAIKELLDTPSYINMSNIDYGQGWHNALTEALNKLKGV